MLVLCVYSVCDRFMLSLVLWLLILVDVSVCFASNRIYSEVRCISTEKCVTERFAQLASRSHYQFSFISFQAAATSARVRATSATVSGWKAFTVSKVSSSVNSWCFMEGL